MRKKVATAVVCSRVYNLNSWILNSHVQKHWQSFSLSGRGNLAMSCRQFGETSVKLVEDVRGNSLVYRNTPDGETTIHADLF